MLAVREHGRLVGLAPFYIRHEAAGRKLLRWGSASTTISIRCWSRSKAAVLAYLAAQGHRFDWADLEGNGPALLADGRAATGLGGTDAAAGALPGAGCRGPGRRAAGWRRALRDWLRSAPGREAGGRFEVRHRGEPAHDARGTRRPARPALGGWASPACWSIPPFNSTRKLQPVSGRGSAAFLRLAAGRSHGGHRLRLRRSHARTSISQASIPGLPTSVLARWSSVAPSAVPSRKAVPEFHFLRGREAYKYDWGAEDRAMYARRLEPSGLAEVERRAVPASQVGCAVAQELEA